MPELYHFFLSFGELETAPPFQNFHFSAARSKMKVKKCTTGESLSVPPQCHYLPPPPQKWYSF